MRKLRFLKPIIFLALIAVFTAIIMGLWNWLMPVIFGLTTITFWQALGLFILGRLLFGRIKPARWGGRRHGFGSEFGRMNPIHKKWKKMTQEQRQEFHNRRRQWRKGGHPFCGYRNPFEESKSDDSQAEK